MAGKRIVQPMFYGPQQDTGSESVDERIFRELRQDGRASFSDLARRLGLTRAVVAARFAELTAAGALRVAAVVHPRVLGFDTLARMSIETSLPTADVADQIKDIDGCVFVSLVTGRAGIVAEFWLPAITDLYERTDQIRRLPGVEGVDTQLFRDISTEPPAEGTSIDQTDRELIAILQQDGRVGFNALGNAVGLSTNGARTRVMRLVSSNAIRIVATKLLPGSLGVGFGIRTAGPPDEAVAFLAAQPGFEWFATCFGKYDLVATVVFETAAQSLHVRDEALRLPSVHSVDSWIHTAIIRDHEDRISETQPA